ncbi:(4Fe-4S)-binding protein [Flavisolibacter ginsengisoli]|jgi:putative redox protein|uniref:Putative redox protein n=1 Tax=Flavisolibacter ginsengisoli DSM 18119 TaxID=1121884 RepID=A0A1M5EN99_9BACT|nr:(4Fe-4S)-binding protein [Flavisolibacter ginsengisoli]SHF80768.1 putative redox protein [Flavisolibacter ginsengisoli DSM 18119]
MKYKLEKPVHGTIGNSKYQCTIEWRNGKFVADEPTTIGGKDTGPDPFTLLLSSLASCKLITLRMYIDRKGWTIDQVAVNANLYQETKEGITTTIIDCDILFISPVSDEQKMQLLDIAKACPISKILQGELKVRVFVYREGDAKTIKYANEEVTVLWKPEFCQHSTRCWTQMPQVFKPSLRKWIDPGGASAEKLEQQIAKCPSGALVFIKNEPENKTQ